MEYEEEPAIGAHGYEDFCREERPAPVFVVVDGWGRGIRVIGTK